MTEEGPRRLGRGLAALLGEAGDGPDSAERGAQRSVPIEFVRPGPLQPRQNFDEEQLRLLADSIRQNGILQPILVRRRSGQPNSFEIVAGERRWRAAQLARLHEVPVIVREIGDREALELAIVENVQRQDLTPVEEAEGYRRLVEEFRYTQEDLARHVGKSRSHIANTLRLLNLPPEVRGMLDRGALTAGHARALLNAADPRGLAAEVVARGLNVRQTERLAQRARRRGKGQGTKARLEKDPDTLALERDLSTMLGLKVAISVHGTGGTLAIHYKTVEQLDDVLQRLSRPAPNGRDQ